MSNRLQLIKKHNNSIQNKKNKTTLSCKFRDQNGFPLNRNCRTENVIYKCTSLTKNNVKKVYLGFTEEEFKKIGTTTINNLSEMKIIKIVPLYQEVYGASNQLLRSKILI